MTSLHIYKQNKETELIPKGFYFTVEKKGKMYKVECFGKQAKAYEIISREAKCKYILNLNKAEVDEYLTMYAYRIYPQKSDKRLAPLIAMSKKDVMEIVDLLKENMKEGDEIFIYKIYGIMEQGQRAVKALVKQGNRLVKGEM